MVTGILLTERMAGWVLVTGGPATSYALPIGLAVLVQVVMWVAVGVNEELVFRGYWLKNLAEGLAGRRLRARPALALAVAFSSITFGLAHLTNHNATAFSTLNIMLGGLLLSLPVLWTGELATSIGLHVAWNLFEGTIYGFPVSGDPSGTHLLSIPADRAGHLDRRGLWTRGRTGVHRVDGDRLRAPCRVGCTPSPLTTAQPDFMDGPDGRYANETVGITGLRSVTSRDVARRRIEIRAADAIIAPRSPRGANRRHPGRVSNPTTSSPSRTTTGIRKFSHSSWPSFATRDSPRR